MSSQGRYWPRLTGEKAMATRGRHKARRSLGFYA